MEKLDYTSGSSWFIIVGFFAIFVAMVGLPALASVAAGLSPWAAFGTVLAMVGLLTVAVTETYRHSPH